MLAKSYGASEAFGIDISSHQINFARSKFEDNKICNYLKVISIPNVFQASVGDLDRIPELSPGSFDLVLSLESFHCFSNLPHLLDSVRTLLRRSAVMPQDDQRPSNQLDYQSTGEFVIGDIFDKS
jgi:cyclopropane fatty-acyl-phospholipid synthase-like methyltransferase